MGRHFVWVFCLAAVLLTGAVALFFLHSAFVREDAISEDSMTAETQREAFPIDGTPKFAESVVLTPPETGDLGAASYLIEPGFALTESNLKESLQDFFAAPCTLDFYLEDENVKGIYRCEEAVLNAKFGEVLASADFYVISMRKYDAAVAAGSVENPYHEASYRRAYFANAIGQVSLIIGKDGTYLDFYRHTEGSADKTESGRTFFAETDLYERLWAVKEGMGADCCSLD